MTRLRARFTAICTLAVLGAAISLPQSALAHGGPPAALGLVAATADGAQVVLLNEGLAQVRPEAWSYMCPRLWGEPGTASGKFPNARSANGVDTWVAGNGELYLLRDGVLTPQQRPDYGRNDLIALTNDTEQVYGLHLVGSQSTELVRLSAMPEAPLWTSQDYWSALTVDEAGIHLARVSGDMQLELVTIDRQGQELSRASAMLPLTPLEIQLHATGGHVYVTGTDGEMSLVGYFDGMMWHQSLLTPDGVLGPQASADGTLWIAVAEKLGRLQGDTVEMVDDATRITCLDQWNDWQYACSGPNLYRLTATGIGEQFFGMDDFHAPDPKLVPPEAETDCSFQWLLYTNDARLLGLTFVDWPDTAAAAGAGAAGQGAGAVPAAAGAGAAGSGAAVAGSVAASSAGAGALVQTAGAAAVTSAAPPASSGGCSVSGRALSADGDGLLSLVVAGLSGALVLRRRRRRSR